MEFVDRFEGGNVLLLSTCLGVCKVFKCCNKSSVSKVVCGYYDVCVCVGGGLIHVHVCTVHVCPCVILRVCACLHVCRFACILI